MNISNIILLWKKEMKELFRDKKTLITIFLPIVIYPIIIGFIAGGTVLVQNNLDKESTRVYIKNIPEKLKNQLLKDKKIKLITNTNDYLKDIENEIIDIAIKRPNNKKTENYNVYYNSTIDRSERGKQRIQNIFKKYTKSIQKENIKKENISIPIIDLVKLEKNQLAEDSDFVGMIAGLILPFIITLYSIIGVVTMSADLTAGEKERGTLETIFSSPIKKIDIISGKLIASMSVGILSTLANLAALFPAVIFIMINFPKFNITINPWIFVICFLMLIPIMIMVSSVIIAVGLFANSFREVQSYIGPIIILFMVPCYIGIIPELEFTNTIAIIPITNGIFVMRDAFMNNIDISKILITIFVNLVLAFIGVFLMNKIFSSEKIIFGRAVKKNK